MNHDPTLDLKPDVLLIAYQCAPDQGSVSNIGWFWHLYLKPHAQVHLITHIRNKQFLSKALDSQDEVTYIDTEAIAGPVYKVLSKILKRSQHALFLFAQFDFLLFGRKLMKWCRKNQAIQNFDLCHMVTPISAAAPHRFGHIGIPLIVGPFNSGMATPAGFSDILKAERPWIFKLRVLGRVLTKIMGTYKGVDLIFSATRANDEALGPKLADRIKHLCENGVLEVAESPPPFPSTDRLELLFIGRLIATKGLPMLFQAMANMSERNLRLRIVGSGPEAPYLEDLAAKLGLQDVIEFCGQQSYEAIPGFLQECHVMALPSVRESGGGVILEAMAQGRPTIALNHGGPAEYITPECGFLLDYVDTARATADLQAILEKLQTSPELAMSKAEACLERVRNHFTWEAKVQAALTEYRRLAPRLEPIW